MSGKMAATRRYTKALWDVRQALDAGDVPGALTIIAAVKGTRKVQPWDRDPTIAKLRAESAALRAERDRAREDFGSCTMNLIAARREKAAAVAERDRLAEALRDLISYAGIVADGGGTLGTLRLEMSEARAALPLVGERPATLPFCGGCGGYHRVGGICPDGSIHVPGAAAEEKPPARSITCGALRLGGGGYCALYAGHTGDHVGQGYAWAAEEKQPGGGEPRRRPYEECGEKVGPMEAFCEMPKGHAGAHVSTIFWPWPPPAPGTTTTPASSGATKEEAHGAVLVSRSGDHGADQDRGGAVGGGGKDLRGPAVTPADPQRAEGRDRQDRGDAGGVGRVALGLAPETPRDRSATATPAVTATTPARGAQEAGTSSTPASSGDNPGAGSAGAPALGGATSVGDREPLPAPAPSPSPSAAPPSPPKAGCRSGSGLHAWIKIAPTTMAWWCPGCGGEVGAHRVNDPERAALLAVAEAAERTASRDCDMESDGCTGPCWCSGDPTSEPMGEHADYCAAMRAALAAWRFLGGGR